ncbi:MAG: Nif3-like dinuclear metal center hexameric protein [Promethearchaeota archaeon]
MVTLLTLVKYIEEIAPSRLVFAGMENRVEIGPQTDSEQEKTTINRVLVATYPSGRVITRASQEKANLLITHRPLFPFALDRIYGADLIRIRLLTKNYISSFTVGTSWIAARGGIADALVETLGLLKVSEFMVVGDYNEMVAGGRICQPPSSMNHSRFANYIAEKLAIDTVLFTGSLDDEVGHTLVMPGYYIDMPEIVLARKHDVKTLVTGELSPDIRLMATEEGLNLLELGQFVTEEPGMKRLRHQISLEFPELRIEFAESSPVSKGLSY